MLYDVVAIVASRRGTSQLRDLVAGLPRDFGTPVVCLVESDPRLVAELSATTPLKVQWAKPETVLEPGNVYLSPPHSSLVLLTNRRIALAPFGAESSAQNPVDTFMRSAARIYANRVLAVMLGAFPEDGVEGARSLKAAHGTMLVLDRTTAEYAGLADAIVHAGSYDHILSAEEVAAALRMSFTGNDLLGNAELLFELGGFLESALRITGTRMGHVQLLDAATQRLHIVAHRGVPRRYVAHFDAKPPDETFSWGRAVLHKRRAVIEDVFADAGCTPNYGVARETGFTAEQSTPFFSATAPAGTVCTLYPDVHRLEEREAKGLDAIGQAATLRVGGRF